MTDPRTQSAALSADAPLVVREALALAGRIKAKYPDWTEREEAQDALVRLAEWIEVNRV